MAIKGAVESVLQLVERREQEIKSRAAWAIEQIELARDRELVQLGLGVNELELRRGEAAKPASPKAKRRPKSRKKASAPTSPAAARERAEALHALLIERGGKVAPGEAREALGFSEGQVRTAVERLRAEGRLKRTGERQATRYEAIGASAPVTTVEGTLQGQLLAAVQGRTFATVSELMEVTGAEEGEVRRECGVLIGEGELEMARRENQPGYVPSAGGA